MKKLGIIIILLLMLAPNAQAANKMWWATGLLGGGDNLDGIDGDSLTAGDGAIVILDAGSNVPWVYIYRLHESGDAESSPSIVSPDSNPGNKRWHLVNIYGTSFSDNGLSPVIYVDTASCIYGNNGSKTVSCYTSIQIDDSAAQIYNSGDSTKLMKFTPSGMTTGKTLTLKGSFDQSTTIDLINTGLSADSKTISLSFSATDDQTVTVPDGSFTIAKTSVVHKLASFAWDGGGSAVTAEAASERCTSIPNAATITGYTMIVDQDPGAGTSILNLHKSAWNDTTRPTTAMDGTAHANPPTVPDDKLAAKDTTLTGWTTAVAADDIICALVATNAVATWISLTIYGTYTNP